MTHNLSIMVDIDDVLFPWYDNAHRLCQEAGLAPEGVTPTSWEVWTHYGCEPQQWWATLREAGARVYQGDPMPGALKGLWKLEAAGHAIHLVTARGTHTADSDFAGMVEAATFDWLARHYVPYDSLTFSKDKTVVPADFAIDDNVGNYDALEAAGTAVWLVDRPWNQDTPGTRMRRRVNSLLDFAQLILDKEAIPA